MQTQVTTIGTFIGGLNTEQPQLADQVQYTVDELNCQLLPDGTRARRYGLEREENSIGIPMTYTLRDWERDSKKFAKDLSEADTYNVDTFSFDVIIEDWGTACTPVTFIQDGDDATYQWFFEAEQQLSNTEWHLKLEKSGVTLFSTILQSTSLPSSYTHFRIKVFLNPNDDTKLMCTLYSVEDGTEQFISTSALSTISDFEFSNYINILSEAFTTDGDGAFKIVDVCFWKDGEVIVTGAATEGEISYEVEYTEPGTYTIDVPEDGVYTVWMVGGGGTQATVQSSRKFSYGYIYNTIHGAGGAGMKCYVYLEAGEYSVVVGKRGSTGTTYLGEGYYYWSGAGATTLKRDDYLDLGCSGGTSNPFWWKEAREASGYLHHRAVRGSVTVVEAPVQFTIVSQTIDGEYEGHTSFITNDDTGPGAINKNGFFKIIKGIVGGNGLQDTVKIKEIRSTAYYWSNYDKKGTDCIVVQNGSTLKFYKAVRPYDSELIAQIDTASQIRNEDFTTYEFSSGEGFLLVCSENAQTFYIILDADAGTASLIPVELQIRDLTGVEDNLLVNSQPGTLTDEHKYNLLNQGWDTSKINSFYSSTSTYPSNALIWWYGKNSSGDFDAGNLTKAYFGTTQAPRGHFILNYFDQDRASVANIPGLDEDIKDKYVTDSAFFAGRFFYLTSSTVLFSQVVKEDVRNIGRCYQNADPTSQAISDIVATDGGEIIFQELGYGKAIQKFSLGLLVFGTKSVYTITSTAGNTFTATQYQTQFVTHAGCVSGKSVVGAEDVVFYWSPQGIYRIETDRISGTQAIATSVSSNTIQHWYNDLPKFSKENCIGAYDYTNRRIVWMYPTDENTPENRNGLLIYYLDFNAFMPSLVSEGGNLITVFETTIPTYIVPSIGLYAGDNEIVAGTNDVIVKNFGEEYGRNFSVCYLGYVKSYDRLFFCDFSSREFIDWKESNYHSYALSYPITFGSTWKKQYVPVLQCFYLRTEEDELTDGQFLAPSSCYARARWKWSDTSDSHRWDLTQQSYIRLPRFMEFRYVNGKIRVKGSGPAVQIMLDSEEDKDFKLSSINMLIRTE